MDRYMGVARLKRAKTVNDFADVKIIENIDTPKSDCICMTGNEIAGAESGENIVVIDDSTIYEIDAKCMNSKNSRNGKR